MAIEDHIRNPSEWGWAQLKLAAQGMGAVGDSIHGARAGRYAPVPAVRHIAVADLRTVLARGLGDFATYRTDVIFLCIVYPIAGLVLARLTFGYDMLPLLFPLASGFALPGPAAPVGSGKARGGG